MTVDSLNIKEFHPYYKTYIDKASEFSLPDGLESCGSKTLDFLESITAEKEEYRYAEGKWTIKEVLQHIIDTERIFAYRALRIARNDETPLAGFEQNGYVNASDANSRLYSDLLNEYKAVKLSTTLLYRSFTNENLMAVGTASDNNISVRALGFMIMGHEIHHCDIIRERYL